MHANIDGDVLIYRSGFAVERTCYKIKFSDGSYQDLQNRYTRTQIKSKLKSQMDLKEDEDYTLKMYKLYEPLENALQICSRQIEKILTSIDALTHAIYLSSSDKSNFRYQVAKTEGPHGPGYKAGRPAKPKYYDDIRSYLLTHWDAEEIFGMEADDALGIYQREDTVACHQDKDIDMIPGNHYNFVTGDFYITEDPGKLWFDGKKLRGGGLKWFYAQLLMGDSTDNIPGCKRYGPVTAHKALEKATTEEEFIDVVWQVYRKQFKKKALTRLEEVANLLWILRKKDDNKGRWLRHQIEEIYNV